MITVDGTRPESGPGLPDFKLAWPGHIMAASDDRPPGGRTRRLKSNIVRYTSWILDNMQRNQPNKPSAESEPQRKIPKLQDIRPGGTVDLDQRYCLRLDVPNEVCGHKLGRVQQDTTAIEGACPDDYFNDLISLSLDRIRATENKILRGETGASGRAALSWFTGAKSSPAQAISEPIRSLEAGAPPPRRFYRTFWRAMTRKALARADQAARPAD
jgi:hypothetical protein